jgi:hypothetical protein
MPQGARNGHTKQRPLLVLASVLIGGPLLLLISPFVLVYFLLFRLQGVWLAFRYRRRFLPTRPLLVVYSDSPNWKAHFESHLLPAIAERSVVLNYSQRATWSRTAHLESSVWQHWAGDHSNNPCVIAFPPSGQPEVIRFYEAFRDFKHGKPEQLVAAEAAVMHFLNSHTEGYA